MLLEPTWLSLHIGHCLNKLIQLCVALPTLNQRLVSLSPLFSFPCYSIQQGDIKELSLQQAELSARLAEETNRKHQNEEELREAKRRENEMQEELASLARQLKEVSEENKPGGIYICSQWMSIIVTQPGTRVMQTAIFLKTYNLYIVARQ